MVCFFLWVLLVEGGLNRVVGGLLRCCFLVVVVEREMVGSDMVEGDEIDDCC